MEDIIDLLERIGQDALLRDASINESESVMVFDGIEPVARSAILAGDEERLHAVLRLPLLCGYVEPGEETPDEDEDEDKEKENLSSKKANMDSINTMDAEV